MLMLMLQHTLFENFTSADPTHPTAADRGSAGAAGKQETAGKADSAEKQRGVHAEPLSGRAGRGAMAYRARVSRRRLPVHRGDRVSTLHRQLHAPASNRTGEARTAPAGAPRHRPALGGKSSCNRGRIDQSDSSPVGTPLRAKHPQICAFGLVRTASRRRVFGASVPTVYAQKMSVKIGCVGVNENVALSIARQTQSTSCQRFIVKIQQTGFLRLRRRALLSNCSQRPTEMHLVNVNENAVSTWCQRPSRTRKSPKIKMPETLAISGLCIG